ncbi:MAG: TAXI family TRAP transporter solute-binding subunit [Magnetococcales bacterium]|nr:TAXI family TRAP transporter solute-binding subunit [Magnetococcales bacterium]
MKKSLIGAGIVVSFLFTAGCNLGGEKAKEAAPPPPIKVSIGSGNPGSMEYMAGAAMCQAVIRGEATAHCENLASDGSMHNVSALHEGKVTLGLARADLAYRAWFGQPPFKERFDNLRVLFALHQDMITLITTQDTGVSTFRDIPGKRIGWGDEGSDDDSVVMDILKSCTISFDALTRVKGSTSLAVSGFKDHSVDAVFAILSHPSPSVTQLAQEQPVLFLPLTENCIAQLIGKRSYYQKGRIPGGLYRGVDADVPTFGMQVWVMAHTDDPEETILAIVKGVFENLEMLTKENPAFAQLSPRSMLPEFSIPYHNGALKYFAQRGWFVLEKGK